MVTLIGAIFFATVIALVILAAPTLASVEDLATRTVEPGTPDVIPNIKLGAHATHTASPALAAAATATPAPTDTPVPTDTPAPTETAVPTDTPVPADTPVPTRTPEPTRTPAPTDTAPAETVKVDDHYWLILPIDPQQYDTQIDRYYPYGTTAQGALPLHFGVEVTGPMNRAIRAAAGGTVVFAGSDDQQALGPSTDFYGQAVVVRLDQDYAGQDVYNLYGHVETYSVQVGQHVDAGQMIATIGMRGVALGPHLHFEVRIGQDDYAHTRNPVLWVKPQPGTGTVAGRLLDADGQPIRSPTTLTLGPAAGTPAFNTQTQTYGAGVNPDDDLGENFVFGAVPAGSYYVAATVGSQQLSQPVKVENGKTTLVIIQAK